MLRAVSSREISEWQAFEREHGPVWQRPDYVGAQITATLANIYRDREKHPTGFEVSEFLMGGTEEWEQTPEQMALVMELTAGMERARESRQPMAVPDD